jgi:hypothetical protein
MSEPFNTFFQLLGDVHYVGIAAGALVLFVLIRSFLKIFML